MRLSEGSETVQHASSDPPVPQALAALLGGELTPADELGDAVRRLSVLVRSPTRSPNGSRSIINCPA